MPVFDLSAEQLAAALREGARGYYPLEAGVELLVAHRVWLQRRDFRGYVEYAPDLGGVLGRSPMAFVAWSDVAAACPAELPASGSETAMLRLAASLADGTAVSLREALTGLDGTNLGLVLDAVAWANRGGDPR